MVDFSSLTIGHKYSRPTLAKIWGYKSYNAFGRGVFTPRDQNIIVFFITKEKQESLTQYEDHIDTDILFWEGEKVNEVLKFFPSYLNTERKLLFLLRNSENNYEHAFQSFSYHLKKLFVHAYQSHLFNKYLKMRFEKYSKNFKEPISGEKLKDGIVYAPIVGAKTELNGETRDIYVTIFEEEGLKEDFFASSAFKRFGGKGAFRKILFVPYDFSYEIGDDDIYNNSTIKLNFKLKKGSYATNVIREFII